MAPTLIARYIDPGILKLVWHDFAWIGEESRQAAQAARCAGRQGKFWEYHDTLYNNQRGENRGQFAADNLKGFASGLGLDADALGNCLAQGADLVQIRQELADARQMGITATPYFFLNGQRLVAGNVETFTRAIETERAKLGV